MNTMKPILITEKNADSIAAALHAVNGTATAHTYSDFSKIAGIAAKAEREAIALLGSKKAAVGVRWAETSGGRVPNAYDKQAHTRIATCVTLERRPSGWFLTNARKATIFKDGGGPGLLFLTAAHEAAAIHELQKRYRMMSDL